MDTLIRDNWTTRTTFWTTLPRYCETSSTVGWCKSEPICKPYPIPHGGFLTQTLCRHPKQWGFTPTTRRKWPTRSGTVTYPVPLPFMIDRTGYRWLGITKSGITGRPVPLSGLLRPNTVRPHWRLDGVSPNLFANLTQSLTAVFSHRRFANIRNSEASLSLHSIMIFSIQ